MKVRKSTITLYFFLLTPLWWLLGFGLFVFHLMAAYMAINQPSALWPRDRFQYALAALIAVLCGSLAVNSVLTHPDFSRILAAINNISILIVGYIIYGYFRIAFRSDRSYVFLTARRIAIVSGLAVTLGTGLLYFVVSGRIAELGFPSLIGMTTPPTDNLIGLYQRVTIITTDWFDENPTPRLTILSTNATSSAALIAISGFFTLIHLRYSRGMRFLFTLLLVCTIGATLTRGAFFGLLAGLAIFFSMALSKRSKVIILPALPLIFLGLLYFLPGAIERANSAREASSATRFASYTASVNVTMEGNPLIGLGIKPRTEDSFIPIGSHSTIMSTLVRGGLLGACIAIFAFFVLPLVWFAKIGKNILASRQPQSDLHWSSVAAMAGVPSLLVFCLLQDIDAYAPLSAFIFCFMALLSHCAQYSSELAGASPEAPNMKYDATA